MSKLSRGGDKPVAYRLIQTCVHGGGSGLGLRCPCCGAGIDVCRECALEYADGPEPPPVVVTARPAA